MSRHIKRVARHFGMDIVGIGQSHPSFLFAGKAVDPVQGAATEDVEGPEELTARLPFLIVGTLAWDYELTQAHRHHVGDAAYDFPGQSTALVLRAIEGYIKELGYNAVRGLVNGQAAALAAGIGELGRTA